MREPRPEPPGRPRLPWIFWALLALLLTLFVLSVAATIGALTRPAGAPPVPAAAQAAREPILAPEEPEAVYRPAFTVGEYLEPPVALVTHLDGQSTLHLPHLWLPGRGIEAPVTALSLVQPYAAQGKLGKCSGAKAYTIGLKGTRNRAFYRNPRIACAAFTAFCMRHCGRPGMSFSATAQYAQVRRRGGKLVASRVSTRYAPYFKFYRRGDLLYFHKGRNRMGHVEFCVGGGWTVGTSSSAGRVGRRRIGNRGFALMSVVRL